MVPSHGLLLQLAAIIALLGAAAAAKHEEAPIVTVNGTLSDHFTAHVTDLQPGACVIFEAQVREHASIKMPSIGATLTTCHATSLGSQQQWPLHGAHD